MRVLCKCTGASDWECICYSKYISDDGTGGPGGPPPIYGRSVNPIPIGGGILSPHITSAPPPKLFTFRHP